MSFEPFDTGLVVKRLEGHVRDLQLVGGAADFAAVKELRSFRTPSAYVVFAEDENTNKVPDSVGVLAQESLVRFGVVLALRNYADQRGEHVGEDARKLIGQVRTALIGHKPCKGARVIGWESGKVLDYDAQTLLFADLYRVQYTMTKDGC